MKLKVDPLKEYVAKKCAEENRAKRSFQYYIPRGDSDDAPNLSSGVAHIGVGDATVNGSGTAVKVQRFRKDSSKGGGFTTYRVELNKGDENKINPGKFASSYVVPLIDAHLDCRDMPSYVDINDKVLEADEVSEKEKEEIEEEEQREEEQQEEDDDSPAWDCDGWKDYMVERVALCQGIVLWLREHLHSLFADGYGEWDIIDTGSEVWHTLGLKRHLAGEGGSDCPICSGS